MKLTEARSTAGDEDKESIEVIVVAVLKKKLKHCSFQVNIHTIDRVINFLSY